MKYYSNEYWDIGQRAANEDSVLIAHVGTPSGQIIMGAVADGIGGLSLGHIASGYILEELSTCFYEEIVPLIIAHKKRSMIVRSIKRCLYGINSELRNYSDKKNKLLGSTLSMILLYRKKYIFVHLGDSGIYRCNEKSMKMITQMHTSESGGVTKCIGSFGYMEPDVGFGKVKGKTGFLLSTDGYYKGMKEESDFWNPRQMISDRIIEKRLAEMGRVVSQTQTDNAGAIYINCV